MRKYFVIFFIILMSVSCSKVQSPVSGDQSDSVHEETQKPSSGTMFDYSMVGGHPRLLLRMDDFARIKSAIATETRLAKVHQHILDRADYLLTQEPLTYQKVGKRLLNVSRAAIERILSMSYLYRMTGEEKYLLKAEATLNEVSSFADWNQDEHYLDVAEMAFGVAVGLDWLYDGCRCWFPQKYVQLESGMYRRYYFSSSRLL